MRPDYHSIPEAIAVFLVPVFSPCDKQKAGPNFLVYCEVKTVFRLRLVFRLTFPSFWTEKWTDEFKTENAYFTRFISDVFCVLRRVSRPSLTAIILPHPWLTSCRERRRQINHISLHENRFVKPTVIN